MSVSSDVCAVPCPNSDNINLTFDGLSKKKKKKAQVLISRALSFVFKY